MPYPTEHSCRLAEPDKFKKFARKNAEEKHDGKPIDAIYGITEDGKSEIQALRYDKEKWSAEAAQAHCDSRDGTFEAAAGEAEHAIMNAEIPADVPEWVMVLRTGTWMGHPAGPEIVTAAHLQSALEYFNRNYAANGADLVIDYHHASKMVPVLAAKAPAAGWIRAMELRNDGSELWGKVLWTVEAKHEISQQEFRYLSPVLRFNAPDRVSGDPVPHQIHRVALTNTPFLTELESLNQNAATDGSGEHTTDGKGGKTVKLLALMASALGIDLGGIAAKLGLKSDADDKAVAEALVANAARVAELEARPQMPEFVTHALGVDAASDEKAIKAAVMRLKAPNAGMAAVRNALGLDDKAEDQVILNAIGALHETRRKNEAEDLVDQAVEAGKVPPAHREFYLAQAVQDLEVAREVINALPVQTGLSGLDARKGKGGKGLTEEETRVGKLLGLSDERMIAARQ